MKRISLIVVSLLILLILIVTVAPSVVDWNNYKSDLTRKVESLTGRKLTIKGNIEVSIFPSPALIANNVYLSNSKGATAKNMFSLESLEVRIAPGPLINGKIKVQTVLLINPVIELQRFSDGRTNLEFSSGKNNLEKIQPDALSKGITEDQQSDNFEPDFSLDNFSIREARMIFRDDTTGRVETIDNFNASFAAGSLIGPFESVGSFVARGVPLDYTISVDKVIEKRTAPVSLTVGLKAGMTKMTFSGAFTGLDDTPVFEGLVKTTGKDLAELAQFMGMKATLPGFLGQDFALESKISASAQKAVLSGVNISLGNTEAEGAVDVNLEGSPSASIDLKFESIDLDKWLILPAIREPASNTNSSPKSEIGEKENEVLIKQQALNSIPVKKNQKSFVMPDIIDLNFNILAQSVILNEGLVREARLSAELSGGEITISQASAQLPGATDIAFFGFVLADQMTPYFDGKLEVSVGNVRALMNWLDTPLPPLPAQRLLKLALSGNVQARQNLVSLTELDLQFDSSRLTGNAALKHGKRPSINADLVLDRFNFDVYRDPSRKSGPVSTVKKRKPKLSTKDNAVNSQQSNFLNALKKFDLKLKSRVNTVVYKGVQVKDIIFDAFLRDGKISISRLNVDKLSGLSMKVSGSIASLGGVPEFSKVRFISTINDLSKLLGLFKLSTPIDARRLGLFTLDGRIDGSAINPLVSFKLRGIGGSIQADGKLSFLPVVEKFKGNLKVVHSDLLQALKSFGIKTTSSRSLGGLNLNSTVKIKKSRLIFDNIESQIGPVSVDGSVKVLLDSPKVKIISNLNTGKIFVDTIFPMESRAYEEKTTRLMRVLHPSAVLPNQRLAYTRSASFSPGRWSNDPVDFSLLKHFDAEINIKSNALIYNNYIVKNTNLDANVNDGILQLEKFNGDLFGGTIKAQATVKAASRPTISSIFKINNLNLGEGFMAVTGEKPATGQVGMNLKIASSGYTVSDLVAASTGRGVISLENVNVKKNSKGTILSSILGLLNELNKIGAGFSTQDTGTSLANITGTFNIDRGIATSNDLSLVSSLGEGKANGKVDFSRWLVDVGGKFEISSNFISLFLNKAQTRTTSIPFSIRGKLDAPKVNLNTAKLLDGGLSLPGLKNVLEKQGLKKLFKKIMPGIENLRQNPGKEAPSTFPEASSGDNVESPPKKNQKQDLQPKDLIKDLLKGLGS